MTSLPPDPPAPKEDGYHKQMDETMAYLLILSTCLTPEHNTDLLRTFSIAEKTFKGGVDMLSQADVDDGEDIMRHTIDVAIHYLNDDLSNFRERAEMIELALSLIGAVYREDMLNTLDDNIHLMEQIAAVRS